MQAIVRSITAAAAATASAATLLLSAGTCAAGAAADAPQPAASAAANPASSPAAVARGRPSILVVFDIDMEVSSEQPAPDAVRRARDSTRRQAYETITAQLKAWATREGVDIDTLLFAQGKKLDMAGRDISHLVVEKITQAAIDNNAADGPRIDTRKWKATAYDTSNKLVKVPRKLGSEDFISDGPACFMPPTKVADDDCRADYLRRLTSHLRWIDLRWGEVEPAPR